MQKLPNHKKNPCKTAQKSQTLFKKKLTSAIMRTRKRFNVSCILVLFKDIPKNAQKIGHLGGFFLDVFRNGNLQRAEYYCVVFSASERLFKSFQFNCRTIFFCFVIFTLHPFDLRRVSIYTYD